MKMPIGGLGMGEIILIFLVVLLLFGAKRLPEIGSALGKGIREFKGSVREIESELKTPLEETRRMPPKSKDEEEEEGPRRLKVTDEEPGA
jgi:sec-independent protein translocase protein TatA